MKINGVDGLRVGSVYTYREGQAALVLCSLYEWGIVFIETRTKISLKSALQSTYQ